MISSILLSFFSPHKHGQTTTPAGRRTYRSQYEKVPILVSFRCEPTPAQAKLAPLWPSGCCVRALKVELCLCLEFAPQQRHTYCGARILDRPEENIAMHQCRNEATAVLASAVPPSRLPNTSVGVIFQDCHVVLNMHAKRNGWVAKLDAKLFGSYQPK